MRTNRHVTHAAIAPVVGSATAPDRPPTERA
jgi:hypothetical protein